MTTCTLSTTGFGKTTEVSGLLHAAGAVLVAISTFLSANAQALRPGANDEGGGEFHADRSNDLIVTGGNAETAEYQGRKAVRLTAHRRKMSSPFLRVSSFRTERSRPISR